VGIQELEAPLILALRYFALAAQVLLAATIYEVVRRVETAAWVGWVSAASQTYCLLSFWFPDARVLMSRHLGQCSILDS